MVAASKVEYAYPRFYPAKDQQVFVRRTAARTMRDLPKPSS